MPTVVVVVFLLLLEVLVEHAGAADHQTVEQPVGLFGVDAVGVLDFPVEPRGRRADLGMANAFVEGMPVERGLELGSVIGVDLLGLEREPGQYVVKELDRRLLVRLG